MKITQDQYMALIKALAKIRNHTDFIIKSDDEHTEESLWKALSEVNTIAYRALEEDTQALIQSERVAA